ncbi:hypothetical protein pdam_00011398 [Pocillopora damicornis]|uniref:Alpha-galactosidase n=1 Tax=Pocillopora damicornis TaxID=46731 RepID=A0A3M6T762_POCDA|nr:hypothetical protein pdam_00011398 [Pocillopora damicornis]
MPALSEAVFLCLFSTILQQVCSLNNGLAITPPMGWMSWERFRCVTDCEKDPKNCISNVGYKYICIDDCWTDMNRTKDGRLQADPKRFPNGIKKLADYVHARGLKLGIYADYGTKTCAGYPGSIHHIKKDAQTFADWGVDYLKLDGCYANPKEMDKGYPKFAKALNKTGRPIVFSCSWPAYQVFMGMKPNYKKIAKHCNLWRNYGDIQDSFQSLVDIFSWYGDNQNDMIPVAGSGNWNDPDMLIIGNFGLSYEQSKLQFALWAILASPLLMSNDLRDIDARSRGILLNTEIIAVNQDKLGKQGKRVVQNKKSFTEVWVRPLSDCGSVAVVLLSLRSDLPSDVEASFSDVGISTKSACARDLFAHQQLGMYNESFTARVNPSGVAMVKLTPICEKKKKSLKKKRGKGKEITFPNKDAVVGLDNGLALTPPMGWMDWERFRCNIDCNKDPENCISEHLIKQMADHLAEDGYRDAGYEYVSIDLHSKRLKLGMYADYGFLTCAGYPGSIDHIEQDAQTFASWEVDYLKVDGCYADPALFDVGYPKFTQALNATGRPILLSCEWPDYQSRAGIKPDYAAIARNCNTWRNYQDVQDSWNSVLGILDHFAENQDTFVAAAGPGHWNDPDMLVIGDFGLNYEQSKAQFALWSILAAPLIMSNDLRNISKEATDILLNREVIAVDQDKLGKMGRRVFAEKDLEVWSRALSDGSVAAVLFNRNAGSAQEIKADFELIGLTSKTASVRDLFAREDLGQFTNFFSAKVNPSGVVMVKLSPVKDAFF